jgi:hypothetical protein
MIACSDLPATRIYLLQKFQACEVLNAEDLQLLVNFAFAIGQCVSFNYSVVINSGRSWQTDKGTNTNYSIFETDDIIRGWENDITKERWIEGIVLQNAINMPADINDQTKFFIINEKLR